MASSAVRATTAYVQKLVSSGQGALTLPPRTFGARAGYPGNKSSSVIEHIARQHGAGAYQNGNGRYLPIRADVMLQLLQGGHVVNAPDATPQAKKQASAQAKKQLWPKQRRASTRGARKVKAQAKASTPDATAQADGTAQAQA